VTDPTSVSRYPLEWPLGWKRTPLGQRRPVPFKTKEPGMYARTVTHSVALERLENELDRIGARDVTLSTNLELRLDGRPRATDTRVDDPGVAVYFRFRKTPTVLACDGYTTVAGNMAAIAAHIDALRRIERYGVGTIEQALAGYKALPADTAANWRAVFGLAAGVRVTLEELDAAYKARAKDVHPDRPGGSTEAMMQANRARDYALEELTT